MKKVTNSTLFGSSANMESGEKELAKESINKADISITKLENEREQKLSIQ